MKNLISNTAFGKHLDTLELSLSAYKQVRQQFDSFLLRSLEIWMFIPCDENGVIFEEPERIHFSTEFDYKAELSVYQEAKGRVLFEGFEIIKPSDKCFILICSNKIQCQFLLNTNYSFCNIPLKDETIEDLVKYNLELTPTAQKQIGL